MIVDFAIPKVSLVIEIDGGVHRLPHVARADEDRDRRLARAGWKVLRVPNDIAFHGDHLFRVIAQEIGLEGYS